MQSAIPSKLTVKNTSSTCLKLVHSHRSQRPRHVDNTVLLSTVSAQYQAVAAVNGSTAEWRPGVVGLMAPVASRKCDTSTVVNTTPHHPQRHTHSAALMCRTHERSRAHLLHHNRSVVATPTFTRNFTCNVKFTCTCSAAARFFTCTYALKILNLDQPATML